MSSLTNFQFTTVVTVSPTCGTPKGLEESLYEICLVQDASGSFLDDAPNLVATDEVIYNEVTSAVLGARFGVAAFIDYAGFGGSLGDFPYRLYSSMSSSLDDWTNGVESIEIMGGSDGPESQYDGIVGAAEGLSNDFVDQPDCGWSDDFTTNRVMIVTTDASFHVPSDGTPYENDFDSTVAVLNRERIRVIGLKAPGASDELDALAAATDGVVLPLTSDGSNIAEAILGGLTSLGCTVVPLSDGCEPLTVSFDPASASVDPGGSVSITTTISLPEGDRSSLIGTTIECDIIFTANGEVRSTRPVSILIGA